ncbi:hypothetical protein EDB89DRAFT_1902083 [Lactarius sanguifluus]|nr:hypothetical protein EDB89DRAFT_1902083 [Lactarius sanguifluus]
MTLSDVQTHLPALINYSTILLGRTLESDLHALQISYLRCIGTAILFHHPRSRPLKPGLAWLTRMWPGHPMQDRGPGGYDPEEGALHPAATKLTKFPAKSPGSGRITILARIARSHSRVKWARTVIVDPGVWHGMSAIAPAMTVACANLCERCGGVDELLGVLDSHEFVFGRPMGLADTLRLVNQIITRTTPKAGTDSLAVAENAENQNRTGTVQMTKARDPIAAARRKRQHRVRNRDKPECAPDTIHAALPPRTAQLLFSGHSDPRSMSTLAA